MIRLLLFCIVTVLVGCDHLSGPTLRNEFSTSVNLTVTYSDGASFDEVLPSCRLIDLGATEVGKWGVKPKENVFIEEIVVQAGEVIHRFDKNTIDSFSRKVKELDQFLVWVVNGSGISFTKSEKCSLIN